MTVFISENRDAGTHEARKPRKGSEVRRKREVGGVGTGHVGPYQPLPGSITGARVVDEDAAVEVLDTAGRKRTGR